MKFFEKDQIFTVPNLLCVIRIVLVPLFLWLYLGEENYLAAVIVLTVSGLSDIIDGWIARRFDQVSELGKILDPIADKLTQLAVFICLLLRYPLMWVLLAAFVLREITVPLLGLLVIRRRQIVTGARWYGKASSVIMYVLMVILILWVDIPRPLAAALIILSAAVCIFAMAMYASLYLSMLRYKDPMDEVVEEVVEELLPAEESPEKDQ